MKGIGKFVQRNGIAMLALFLALGGTTYAASTALIGANTVASPQVVNGSLKAKDLSAKARKALKGNRGLRGFKGAQGARGATGPQGTTGIQGPKGNAGATNVITRTATVSVPAGGVAAVIAVCNAGEVATGGGALLSGYFNTGPATVVRSYPSLGNSEGNAGGAAPTSWTTRMYNPTGGALNADGYVVCASP
jgi:Collagen triple helix repeat (20 copies)